MAGKPSTRESAACPRPQPCPACRRTAPALSLALVIAIATALAGCDLSQPEAVDNAYLAALDGLNIDNLVQRQMGFDDGHPTLTVSPPVAAALQRYHQFKNRPAARSEFQDLAAEYPQDPSVHYYFAKVLQDGQEYSLARDEYRKAIALRSNLPELWLDYGDACLQCDQPLEAANAAQSAAAADPDSPDTLQRAAAIFYRAHQYDFAEAALATVTNLRPSDPEAWHDRGRNFVALNRADLAMASFDHAVNLYAAITAPTAAQMRAYSVVLTDYGLVAAWDSYDEKSKVMLLKAVGEDPTNARAWYRLSLEQSKPELKPLYDPDGAIRSANNAVSLTSGKNAAYLHQLAKVYAIVGDMDLAVRAEEEACALVKGKYDEKLALLKRLQEDRSKAFNPDQF
ncbi:MAG: tetratricopeptide repeat protein [Planctomycetota bacterium]